MSIVRAFSVNISFDIVDVSDLGECIDIAIMSSAAGSGSGYGSPLRCRGRCGRCGRMHGVLSRLLPLPPTLLSLLRGRVEGERQSPLSSSLK